MTEVEIAFGLMAEENKKLMKEKAFATAKLIVAEKRIEELESEKQKKIESK
ncbi:hypothetical protein [Domibacillus mangrovi]|uniref:hypothetical protein n=1 Tax=Domibacillus mangrovi TaxID=1714354 RepID=UPI000B0EDE75|nr:hypothetical protein [Domibacillus mangrovi]